MKSTSSPTSNQTAQPNDEDGDEEGDSEQVDVSKLDLPYVPFHLNPEYLQETGDLVYFIFPEKDRFHGNKPKHHRIQLVLSKPVKATTAPIPK